jgi:hypothetical protein
MSDPVVSPATAERTNLIRRAASRLCSQMGWAALHEVRLPNGRRADLLALRPDGQFTCIEIKSGAPDFLSDGKWQEYRDYCDYLCFAVDTDFPLVLLPPDVGLIITADREAELVRQPPGHPMAAARRRSLTHRFATLAALRLAHLLDPEDRAALRVE